MLSLLRNRQPDAHPPKTEMETQGSPQISDDKFVILVGFEQKEFLVDVEVLTQGNDYFEIMFIRTLTEQGRRVLRMPSLDTEVFQAYLQYAYGRRVIVMDSEDARQSRSKAEEQVKIANLWDFANSITDVALQNATTDAFVDTLQAASVPISVATIHHLWEITHRPNPLCHIVINWFLAKSDAGPYLEKWQHRLPSDFFVDLALYYADAPMPDRPLEPYEYDRCRFHLHTDAVPPCASVPQRLQLTQENLGEELEDKRRSSSDSVTFGRGTRSEIEAARLFG